jgi:hypothetical protein
MKRMSTVWMLTALTWLAMTQSGWCFYNPSTGRWLSRDPIGERGGRNLYGFVRNGPINYWDNLGQKCCLLTWHSGQGISFGHSALSCGDNNEIYISFHPASSNDLETIVPAPGRWHDPDQDTEWFKPATPSKICFDCLDESKVAAWLSNARGNNMDWSYGNNCSDAARQAIAAGLPDQQKPKCPCSADRFTRWEVEDLLNPPYAIDMPASLERRLQDWQNSGNGCQRYKCVRKNLHTGQPVN